MKLRGRAGEGEGGGERQPLPHLTVTLVWALPDLPQSIFTGQVPRFVFEPTLHVQVIVFAVFGPSPAASERVVE